MHCCHSNKNQHSLKSTRDEARRIETFFESAVYTANLTLFAWRSIVGCLNQTLMSLQQKRRDANYAAPFWNQLSQRRQLWNQRTQCHQHWHQPTNFDATTITASIGVRIDPLEPKHPAQLGTLLKTSHLLIVLRTKNESLRLLNTLVRKNA